MPRPAAYYEIAGVNLVREGEHLRRLPVFAAGRLPSEPPAIKVRRASRRPTRLGFAIPTEWRVSVTAYPGIRGSDVRETLLHELVHLHVGAERGQRRWHGRRFRDTLHRAMVEAYGVDEPPPASTRHGAYADALERRQRLVIGGAEAEQLALAIHG